MTNSNMRFIALKLIDLYQIFLSPRSGLLMALGGVNLPCKYEISCSQYAKQQIKKNGVIIGSYEGLRRIISCR